MRSIQRFKEKKMKQLIKVCKCPKCLADLKPPISLVQTCQKCNAKFKSLEIIVAQAIDQGARLR